MKKYQELESKIVELQKEVDRLKEEENPKDFNRNLCIKSVKIVELQQEVDRLKEEEKQNKLPKGFYRDACIKFLKTFSGPDLFHSFSWGDTPQGEHYWDKIYNNIVYSTKPYEVPKDAIIYIQSLIIKSYQQEESK